MANISITYSFSNGTTADASQANQNFTDIINGTSDGTKDFSISALTAAGNVSLTGSSIALGNAAGDDLTITASLASTINIKTTASYDIGSSTLGLAGIYFGANSQTVRIVPSGSMSATWTLTLPVTAGTANYILTTNGSGVSAWTVWSTSAWAATTSALGTVYLPNGSVTSDTGNGHGSTDTAIRRITNSTVVGTAITVSNTAGAGNVYTIAEAGVYGVNYTDQNTGAGNYSIGVSTESTQLTTNIQTITAANRICWNNTVSTGYGIAAGTFRAVVNDDIRPHTDGTPNSTAAAVNFRITQLFRTA